MPALKELLTLAQAAEYLGVCVHSIINYVKRGVNGRRLRVAALRGRRPFFATADIDEFVRGDEPAPAPPKPGSNKQAKEYLRSKGYKV